jgi:HK97 family phage portal protein
MRLFGKKTIEKKESPISGAIIFNNKYIAPSRNIKSYIAEGYAYNPIVYRCIKEISTAIGSVDLYLKIGGKDVEENEITKILKRPNITQSWPEFIREAVSEYLISGNCYILQSPEIGKPIEFYVMQSQYTTVEMGAKGLPSAYIYDTGNFKKKFLVDQITGLSAVIHWRDYNPSNKFSGMPTMSAAALSADVHNNGLKWNASLLENGGKMSGILQIAGEPSDDAIQRLKKYFKEQFQGKDNAGGIPVATDGAEFKPFDRSPVEMDYMSTMKETAKYIASCFGVPLPLIDNDNSSFNNVEQAKERLWTDTVLPLLDGFLNVISVRFSALYGKEIEVCYDADSIPTLEKNRQTKSDRLKALVGAGLITINEAREELGYDAIDGGDTLFLSSSNIPISMAGDTGSEDAGVVKALGRLGLSKDEIFEATGK